MRNIWLKHLSTALSLSGTVAYVWYIEEDRFEWVGDIESVFGAGAEHMPTNKTQYHQMLDISDVSQRLTYIQKLLGQPDTDEDRTLKYRLRNPYGCEVAIKETITLDRAQGKIVLRGMISKVAVSEKVLPKSMPYQEKAVGWHGGAGNFDRAAIIKKMEAWQEQVRTGRDKAAGYLLVAGIDRLSLMNEAFGARYVDGLIHQTSLRLAKLAGDSGYCGRIDGDVFAIFFPKAPANEMAAVAHHILNQFFDAPIVTPKGPVGVSVSIGGIAVRSGSQEDAASFITMAEAAMREAKRTGGQSFVSYEKVADERERSKRLIGAGEAFLKALKDQRIALAFQPVIGTQSQDVSFHEALIRMIGEDGSVLPAAEFIPAVEKMGLSRLVDRYALRLAIEELEMFSDLRLSVNVSKLTLANPDWLRGIVASLRDRPSIARRLIIEITESAAIDDLGHTIRIVKTLKDLGCRVALDDFGTGYTAFAQIQDFDVDIVKIDKHFIRNIGEKHNHLFVQTLQSLARGVQIETVGEGAETRADARRLANDGIDHIQGFVYGFPLMERVWLPKDHSLREPAILSARGNDLLIHELKNHIH